MDKIDKINELIDRSLRDLTNVLDEELYIPVKMELAQKKVTHSLGFKKELFKDKMEKTFQDLKIGITKIDSEKSEKMIEEIVKVALVNKTEMEGAHKFSINHRKTILKDKKCGCFYCMKIFPPTEISDWIEDKIDGTAICPYCGIDSVICESSGFPITEEFLLEMKKYWFFM